MFLLVSFSFIFWGTLDFLAHTDTNCAAAAAAAKSLQSCPTLCDPIDGSPPGSPIPGILQARILEWLAISFSNAWKWKVKVKSLSHVRLLVTPWTAAYQAPPSMGLSRQEYWSGVPSPSLNNCASPTYFIEFCMQGHLTTYCICESYKIRKCLPQIPDLPIILRKTTLMISYFWGNIAPFISKHRKPFG